MTAGSGPASHPPGLGVVVPALNTVLERDLPRLPLDDVHFHFTRVPFSAVTAEQLGAMQHEAVAAAAMLASARGLRAIALACTSGSFLEGPAYDRQLAAAMEEASGLPCVTTSSAVVGALRMLGITRPMVFTPYPEWVAQRCARYLQASGFEVMGLHFGFGTEASLDTDDMGLISDWIGRQSLHGANGIFISCTNFGWLRGIQALEERLEQPVVTSNQATVHGLLRAASLDRRLPGYGRLLA